MVLYISILYVVCIPVSSLPDLSLIEPLAESISLTLESLVFVCSLYDWPFITCKLNNCTIKAIPIKYTNIFITLNLKFICSFSISLSHFISLSKFIYREKKERL